MLGITWTVCRLPWEMNRKDEITAQKEFVSLKIESVSQYSSIMDEEEFIRNMFGGM